MLYVDDGQLFMSQVGLWNVYNPVHQILVLDQELKDREIDAGDTPEDKTHEVFWTIMNGLENDMTFTRKYNKKENIQKTTII